MKPLRIQSLLKALLLTGLFFLILPSSPQARQVWITCQVRDAMGKWPLVNYQVSLTAMGNKNYNARHFANAVTDSLGRFETTIVCPSGEGILFVVELPGSYQFEHFIPGSRIMGKKALVINLDIEPSKANFTQNRIWIFDDADMKPDREKIACTLTNTSIDSMGKLLGAFPKHELRIFGNSEWKGIKIDHQARIDSLLKRYYVFGVRENQLRFYTYPTPSRPLSDESPGSDWKVSLVPSFSRSFKEMNEH